MKIGLSNTLRNDLTMMSQTYKWQWLRGTKTIGEYYHQGHHYYCLSNWFQGWWKLVKTRCANYSWEPKKWASKIRNLLSWGSKSGAQLRIHRLFKLGLPTQCFPATSFKSLASWQNEKNSSWAWGKFENCTHNIKADTVSPHNIFIMCTPLPIRLHCS